MPVTSRSGAFRERCERRALVHPDLADPFRDLDHLGKGVFHVGDEKIGRRIQLRVGVGPVGHHIETDRLSQRDHVGRNRYAHVVTSAPQLPADDGARLDIAPTPIRGQYNFNRLNLTRGPRRDRLRLAQVGPAPTPPHHPPHLSRGRPIATESLRQYPDALVGARAAANSSNAPE